MRTSYSVLALFVLYGCASAGARDTPDAPPPPSLREQLATPVHLAIDPPASTGAVTAREHVAGGWHPSRVALAIDDGALSIASAGPTSLGLAKLEIDLAPIALTALPGDAHLTNISLRLDAATTIGVTWQDDDSAIALASLDLDLAWSFSASGGTIPLGTQRLAAVPVAITLGREGDDATAAIALVQPGELWTWADLLALDDLALDLPARTAAPVIE